MTTQIIITSKSNFDPATEAILEKARTLFEEVINSDGFAEKVRKADLRHTNGYDNEAILQLLRAGTDQPNTIRLSVSLYVGEKREIGHTDNNLVIHTNRKYVLDNGAPCYAAHLAHEYCHVLGFRHSRWRFPGSRRQNTVPYAIGDIVGELLGCMAL